MGPRFDRAVYQALTPRERTYGATLNRGLNPTMPNKATHADNRNNALCWGAEARFATEPPHSKLGNYLVGIGA